MWDIIAQLWKTVTTLRYKNTVVKYIGAIVKKQKKQNRILRCKMQLLNIKVQLWKIFAIVRYRDAVLRVQNVKQATILRYKDEIVKYKYYINQLSIRRNKDNCDCKIVHL